MGRKRCQKGRATTQPELPRGRLAGCVLVPGIAAPAATVAVARGSASRAFAAASRRSSASTIAALKLLARSGRARLPVVPRQIPARVRLKVVVAVAPPPFQVTRVARGEPANPPNGVRRAVGEARRPPNWVRCRDLALHPAGPGLRIRRLLPVRKVADGQDARPPDWVRCRDFEFPPRPPEAHTVGFARHRRVRSCRSWQPYLGIRLQRRTPPAGRLGRAASRRSNPRRWGGRACRPSSSHRAHRSNPWHRLPDRGPGPDFPCPPGRPPRRARPAAWRRRGPERVDASPARSEPEKPCARN